MPVILTILGFLLWWPIGLLALGFFLTRGRCGFGRRPLFAGDAPMMDWDNGKPRWERKIARMQEKMDVMRSCMDRPGRGWFAPSSSGNHAFDEYRAETLKRLEDEQREFKDFLERLRFARDRAEFDQFMAERRQRPAGPDAPPEGPTGEARN